MARLEGDVFLEPLSSDLPCGPDLERDSDLDFTAFLVDAEGALPASFFSFTRDTAALAERLDRIVALSTRTRDLRLLALYAKFAILDRDLPEFLNALGVIARSLEERWDTIHPQAEGGDRGLRAAVLSTLDDTPHVVMPMQHVVLLRHRTLGDITYRSLQIARRVITPRDGEAVPELSYLERALEQAGPERLSAVRDLFEAILAAVARIEAACATSSMPDVKLPKLTRLATDAAMLLDAYLPAAAHASGELASGEEDGATDGDDGPERAGEGSDVLLKDRAGAAAALAGIEAYFRRHEPSSPALVLVRFAGRLMDRPFFEVLQLIVPDQASDAELKIGGSSIRVSLERIAADMEAMDRSDADSGQAITPPLLETRRDAIRLMSDLARYLRSAEPANPVPLFLDRAAELAGRDFSSLLKDMFSDAALRAMKGERE